MLHPTSGKSRSSGVFMGVLLALLLPLVTLTGFDRANAETSGNTFSIQVNGKAVMGGTRVAVDVSGDFNQRAAKGRCEGAQIREGTLEIGTGAEAYTGMVTEGWASAGSCIPGLSGVVFFNAHGVMDDEAFTEFDVLALGKVGENGAVTDVVGLVSSFVEWGPPEDMAGLLEGSLYAFGGKFEGTGQATGFQVSPAGRGFTLNAAGTDQETKIVLQVKGSVSVESDGPRGYPSFEVQGATLKIGDVGYAIEAKKFRVNIWDRGQGEIFLAGKVTGDDGKVGLILSRFRFYDLDETIFTKGGQIDLESSMTRIVVGGTLYRPEMTGMLSIAK